MNEISWYNIFLDNLYERYPKKSQLAEELISLLCIEREAVYRRLRKEVMFLAHEVVKIAAAWNISLDEIIGIHSGLISFQMQPLNYIAPSKKEMSNLQKRVSALEHVKSVSESEYMEVCNKLPRPIHICSLPLYRFEIFKWVYQYNFEEPYLPYSQIVIPDMIIHQFETYQGSIKNFSTSNFILDPMIFDFLVHNINYFHSILLITDEERIHLKSKLHEMLDYLNELANKGCYPDTLKKVNIYISLVNINTNYSYYYTDKLKSCRVHAFGKYDICSYDAEMVTTFRTWMNLKKRASIQISGVNEKYRIEYFANQRKIVDSL